MQAGLPDFQKTKMLLTMSKYARLCSFRAQNYARICSFWPKIMLDYAFFSDSSWFCKLISLRILYSSNKYQKAALICITNFSIMKMSQSAAGGNFFSHEESNSVSFPNCSIMIILLNIFKLCSILPKYAQNCQNMLA